MGKAGIRSVYYLYIYLFHTKFASFKEFSIIMNKLNCTVYIHTYIQTTHEHYREAGCWRRYSVVRYLLDWQAPCGIEWRYVEAPDSHTTVDGRAGGAPTPGYSGAEFLAYTAAPGTGYVQQGELIEYAGGAAGGPAGHHQAYRRHPRVRPQQGQPGLSGEPVRAIRVALHPYH